MSRLRAPLTNCVKVGCAYVVTGWGFQAYLEEADGLLWRLVEHGVGKPPAWQKSQVAVVSHLSTEWERRSATTLGGVPLHPQFNQRPQLHSPEPTLLLAGLLTSPLVVRLCWVHDRPGQTQRASPFPQETRTRGPRPSHPSAPPSPHPTHPSPPRSSRARSESTCRA